MTNEEALTKVCECAHETYFKFDESMTEALATGAFAINKQIPAKPDRNKEYGFCKCPNGHNIPKICEKARMKYCPMCGQAIDWSDEP